MLAALRGISHEGNEGIALRELGRRVKPDFDERDPYWLYAAVESLCKDGLARVQLEPEAAGLPGMVTEERASYGAGSGEPQSSSLDQTVNLP